MVTQKCDIPHLGSHWFNDDTITNIISLADISEKIRVAMDTQREKALIVHMDDKKIKFSQIPRGLYARKPGDNNDKATNYNHMKLKETQQNHLRVKVNYKFLSNRQIKKAQELIRLQNTLGMPSHTDLKTIITMNMIQNNQITYEDINLARRTFGNQLAV